MDDIQRSSPPKSKMASSYPSRCMCCVLETILTRKFAADLSLLTFQFTMMILVADLATNFQELVAEEKNLVALAPVLGAISRPAAALTLKTL